MAGDILLTVQKTSDAETKAREAARRLAEEKVKEQLAKAKRDQDLKYACMRVSIGSYVEGAPNA